MKAWEPPESPLRIEFPDDLLTRLEPDPARMETTGLLYGSRQGTNVYLTLPGRDTDQPGEVVGIYVLRKRGEVFLTEANVALFERIDVPVALVIAGAKGGFFVRDRDGALQSVRSLEEIPISRPRPGGIGSAVRNKWKLAAAFFPLAALLDAAPASRRK
ncbi:MAG TPA: hypothetical protein VH639_28435 [Bryobacteraceae bacterium]